jgi:hypothetical protein
MKHFASLLFLVLVVGCTKRRSDCSFPTFSCLQGNWIEKEHTDSPLQVKEYIRVSVENNREIFDDETYAAQLSTVAVPIGKFYFEELADQDSVALTPVWGEQTYHWYLKMISDNEIEIDYGLPPGPPISKKRYIRE